MAEDTGIVGKDVHSAMGLLTEVFEEAGRKDLVDEIRAEGLIGEAQSVINELIELQGGHLVRDGHEVNPADTSELKVLVGHSYHISIKESSWKLVVAAAPHAIKMLINGIQPGGGMLPGGAWNYAALLAIAAVDIVRKGLKKLEPDEVLLYCAIKHLGEQDKSVTGTELLQHLDRISTTKDGGWTEADIARCLGTLLEKGAITQTNGRYVPVT